GATIMMRIPLYYPGRTEWSEPWVGLVLDRIVEGLLGGGADRLVAAAGAPRAGVGARPVVYRERRGFDVVHHPGQDAAAHLVPRDRAAPVDIRRSHPVNAEPEALRGAEAGRGQHRVAVELIG